MPSLQSPTGPGALGAAPRTGEPDPEAFHLAGYPISGHLAAMAAAPPSPVSGALISQGRGWTRPEFFPSASRLECPRLSPTTLRPAPRMKLAAQEPPAQFLPFCSCFLGTPLPPVSQQSEPKAASSRKPFLVYRQDPSRSRAGTWTVAQGPPLTLGSQARPGSHLVCKQDPCLTPTAHQLGAAGITSLPASVFKPLSWEQ